MPERPPTPSPGEGRIEEFDAIDAPIVRAALNGDIRLLSVSGLLWLCGTLGPEARILRRQDIEARHASMLLSPDEAVEALMCRDRRVGLVSYANASVSDPDPHGNSLHALCSFLSGSTGWGDPTGRHLTAIFWDYGAREPTCLLSLCFLDTAVARRAARMWCSDDPIHLQAHS